MKAWRVYGAKDIRLEELASQPVGNGCVKLKINYSSLSLTDKMIYDGALAGETLPIIIGRQAVGMVTEVGEGVSAFSRGDRVAVEPFLAFGACGSCKAGRATDCEKMLTFGVSEDGFLRDFAVVHASKVYKLPERVKDNEAVFLEHIALAINAFNKLCIEKGEHLVIVGANMIGVIMAQLALYYQAVPIIVDSRPERLAIADSLGAYYSIDCVNTDVQKKIFSLTGGRMAEAVAHIANTSLPVKRSLEYASRGGRVVLAGWNGISKDLNVSLCSVLNKQLQVFGVNNCAKSIPSAINMLANKTVSVQPLISGEIEFDKVKLYLDEMLQNPDKYIKLIVKN